MKTSKRTLLILHILGWSLAGLLFLALDRRQQPRSVVITGVVLDPASMKPLTGVAIAWGTQKTQSDPSGRYEISVPVGIRELTFTLPGRPSVSKLLIVRQPAPPVTQDVLLPADPETPRKVLALDRGSRLGPGGKELESDVAADSTLSLADEYGNHDQLLNLKTGRMRVHSPIWQSPSTVLFGREGVLHRQESLKALGVFQFQLGSGTIQQIASETSAHFLSKSPKGDSLAVADQKDLYIMDSVSKASALRRIFSLGRDQGFLLSVLWGPDDRVYFTVDDSVPVDERHSLSRSRIASVKPDGSDLNASWAGDAEHSYRYPVRGEGQEILFARFNLDGKEQTLWSRDLRTGKTKPLFQPGLRMVYQDPKGNRLYYIYQQNLHFRNLKSGTDLVILNSVREADYLR